MAEPTRDDTPPTIPAAYGWCAWHQGHARGVRLISAQDVGSGPGTNNSRFACPPCREAYDLVPLADRP
jgi:hypothetical protein